MDASSAQPDQVAQLRAERAALRVLLEVVGLCGFYFHPIAIDGALANLPLTPDAELDTAAYRTKVETYVAEAMVRHAVPTSHAQEA